MKGLIWTVLGLAAYFAAVFAIGKTPLIVRRVYIRVWFWWHNFCPKHAESTVRYYSCSQCLLDEEKAAEEAKKQYRAERGLLMDKAEQMVKEL